MVNIGIREVGETGWRICQYIDYSGLTVEKNQTGELYLSGNIVFYAEDYDYIFSKRVFNKVTQMQVDYGNFNGIMSLAGEYDYKNRTCKLVVKQDGYADEFKNVASLEAVPFMEQKQLVQGAQQGQSPEYGQVPVEQGALQVSQHEGRVAAGDEQVDANMVQPVQQCFPSGFVDAVVKSGGRVKQNHGADENPGTGQQGASLCGPYQERQGDEGHEDACPVGPGVEAFLPVVEGIV
jgi:hypothetical protein